MPGITSNTPATTTIRAALNELQLVILGLANAPDSDKAATVSLISATVAKSYLLDALAMLEGGKGEEQ